MRRVLSMLLIVVTLCCMCGCHSKKSEMQNPVNFYYCKNPISFYGEDDVIIPEIRDAFGYDDLVALTNLYLQGPKSDTLSSPFPARTTVRELIQQNGKVSISVSSQFAMLKGIDLTLSCACLSMTLLELTAAESVVISAEGNLLDGAEYIVMTKDSFAVTDFYNQYSESTLQTEE